jgi:hypothetical protein
MEIFCSLQERNTRNADEKLCVRLTKRCSSPQKANEQLCCANLKKHFLHASGAFFAKVKSFPPYLKTIIPCELCKKEERERKNNFVGENGAPEEEEEEEKENFFNPEQSERKHFHLHTKMFALENLLIFFRVSSGFVRV